MKLTLILAGLILSITPNSFATSTAPYLSQVCSDSSRNCTFTLLEKDQTGNFAVYLVRDMVNNVTFGELVSLNERRSLNFIGGGGGCSLGEGGCSGPMQVYNAHFFKTQYGNVLAGFDIGLGRDYELSIDLCGKKHPIGYLRSAPIHLPQQISSDLSPFQIAGPQGNSLVLKSSYPPVKELRIDAMKSIAEGYLTTNLTVSEGGSQGGAVQVSTTDGMTRWFIVDFYQANPSYYEMYRQPDNSFSYDKKNYCSL